MAVDYRDVEGLTDAAEPGIRNGFLGMVIRVTGGVELRAIEDAIRSGSPDRVWVELAMNEAAFDDMREAERAAFRAGGRAEAAAHGWAFSMGAQGAEAEIGRRIGRLIREIQDDTREMIVERVTRGIAEGTNPRRVALDIVGRRKIGTHRRTGGMVGLTRHQEGWVQNALAELSGDRPMGDYFSRTARDRRFDRTVARAIREGRPVPAAMREKMIAAYRSRLLRMRGEAIARTEAIGAVNGGRQEAIDQAINDGDVPAEQVQRSWVATLSDNRTRDTHRAMHGQRRRQGEPFVSPSGARLMYPGDRSLGAPAAEVVSCRCTFAVRLTR